MNLIPLYDQDMSWLSFNERVLQEAADISVPVIERVRFLGIYSTNLDEFFRVKVANLKSKVLIATAQNELDNPYKERLDIVLTKVNDQAEKFQKVMQQVFNELSRQKINLLLCDGDVNGFTSMLSTSQRQWLKEEFNDKIVRKITPIILNDNTALASYLEDGRCYFFVALHQVEDIQYALIEIPRHDNSRFIILPDKKQRYIALIDDVIHFHLNDIFARFFLYTHIEAYSIELTRDADYHLTDEIDQSLLNKMSKGIKQRINAEPVRLVYDRNMPDFMLKFLRKMLKIKELDHLAPGYLYRHIGDFIDFPNIGSKKLQNPKIKALESQRFSVCSTVFSAINARDILLYYPYHRFNHFIDFIHQASYDPDVKEIKINIYRVSKKSPIIHSLMDAVKNGKKVTVVVELRARFDEQTNIDWSTRMVDAGINVEFGINTLKIHSKLCLISREEQGELVRYAHIGTGNFHEKNARIYTDFSLFTRHEDICLEVENIFTFISHSYKRFNFEHLLVSPLNNREGLYRLIDNEIASLQKVKSAEITIKVNNLVDKALIAKLYSASTAGVNIKIIVRGMCALIPGLDGVSDNIEVISIVDRFLEHPRVMIFANSGEPLVYISSADWMERNLDHRVEVTCPIYDDTLKRRIIHIIELQFKDTMKARLINESQDNHYVISEKCRKIRSQTKIYDYLMNEELKDQQSLAPVCLTNHNRE